MSLSYQEKYDWYMNNVVSLPEDSPYLRLKATIDAYNWVTPPPPPPTIASTDSIAGAWWANNYAGEFLPT